MPVTHRDFKMGSRGPDVERFQRALKRRLDARGEDATANRVEVDGEIGPKTARAAKKALWLLGATEDTSEAAGRGVINMGAQKLVIDPSIRTERQLDRARTRMKAEKKRDKIAAKKGKASGRINEATHAAQLALRNRGDVHYTQGGARWQGIDREMDASKGQYPRYADCSSFYTWCLWQLLGQGRDVVNGQSWRAGYTGTLATHGRRIEDDVEGAAALYGGGWPYGHVAYCLGNGQVISHGSEGGPYLLPLRYRGDLAQIRRYH